MNIGFFHIDTNTIAADQGYVCARALVKSVRKCMPDVPVIHFTDQTSPGVKGVDAVRRKPSEPMALLRMRHHAGVEGDWLFVDTDVILQHTVRRMFLKTFDIAITTRNWSHLKAAAGFSARMPFNTGVVFSRCPRFWGEVYCRLRHLELAKQQWMGDQEVICDMIADDASPYVVAQVPGEKFNFPPRPDDYCDTYEALLADASIVHYKGSSRKAALMRRVTCA